MTGDWIIISAA